MIRPYPVNKTSGEGYSGYSGYSGVSGYSGTGDGISGYSGYSGLNGTGVGGSLPGVDIDCGTFDDDKCSINCGSFI